MRRTNINAVLNMLQEFLDGEMDSISFQLDFPYEIEQRYRKMVREDSDFADMIYFYMRIGLTQHSARCSDSP